MPRINYDKEFLACVPMDLFRKEKFIDFNFNIHGKLVADKYFILQFTFIFIN